MMIADCLERDVRRRLRLHLLSRPAERLHETLRLQLRTRVSLAGMNVSCQPSLLFLFLNFFRGNVIGATMYRVGRPGQTMCINEGLATSRRYPGLCGNYIPVHFDNVFFY